MFFKNVFENQWETDDDIYICDISEKILKPH